MEGTPQTKTDIADHENQVVEILLQALRRASQSSRDRILLVLKEFIGSVSEEDQEILLERLRKIEEHARAALTHFVRSRAREQVFQILEQGLSVEEQAKEFAVQLLATLTFIDSAASDDQTRILTEDGVINEENLIRIFEISGTKDPLYSDIYRQLVTIETSRARGLVAVLTILDGEQRDLLEALIHQMARRKWVIETFESIALHRDQMNTEAY